MNPLPAPRNVWFEVHPKLGISLMDHLFNRLDGAYPNRWRASFPSETSIQNWRESWAEAFVKKQITLEEIKRGISGCQDLYDWPPSLPEFLKACRPPINPEASFAEAVKQLQLRKEGNDTWSHPAIYWASQSIGTFDMLNLPWAVIKGRWTKALAEFLDEPTLPAVPAFLVQLPPPGQTSIAPGEAHKRIEEAVSGIKPPADYKAWAKEKIANPQAYPGISLQMAQEALERVDSGEVNE